MINYTLTPLQRDFLGEYCRDTSNGFSGPAYDLFDFCPYSEDHAAGARAWSSRQRKGRASFSKASRCPGIAKTHSTHSQRLTAVMAAGNVTSCFPAQSTARTPA